MYHRLLHVTVLSICPYITRQLRAVGVANSRKDRNRKSVMMDGVSSFVNFTPLKNT